MTGYAIYSTINLHIRIRTCWLYFSCLFDCLQRRLMKYTYSEICSHGSKYEYTCLGNYLPDSTASDPPPTPPHPPKKNCSLSPQTYLPSALTTLKNVHASRDKIRFYKLLRFDISVMRNCGRSDII